MRLFRRDEKVEGLIGYYGLGDWWLATFSPEERANIESVWGYITLNGKALSDERPLTRGAVTSNPLTAAEFLLVVTHRILNERIKSRFLAKVRELTHGQMPGHVGSEHYNVVMERAKALISEGRIVEADPLVSTAFDAFESESRIGPLLTQSDLPPPANYQAFAILYRKQKDYAREIAILNRYINYPGVTQEMSQEYRERRDKAQVHLERQSD